MSVPELIATLPDGNDASPGEQGASRLLAGGTAEHAIFMMDAAGHILTWSSGVGSILGYSREEWVGHHGSLLFLPEDCEEGLPQRELETARTHGFAEDVRWHRKKNGARFFADSYLTPLYDKTGEVIGFGKMLRDATQRELTERRLRDSAEALVASEERLSAVIDTAMDAIVTAGEDQRILSANPAAREMFGYEAHEVAGQPLELLMPERFRFDHSHHVRRFGRSGETRRTRESFGVLTARRKDGTEFPIEASVSRFQDAQGQTVFAAFVRDISERVRAESALRETLARERARAEREELINEIGDGIRQALPPAEIEVLAVRALGKALSADRCYLMTVDLPRDAIAITRDWCVPGVASLVGQCRVSDMGVDFGSLFAEGKTLVVTDARPESERRLSDANAVVNQRAGVTAFINVPFYGDDNGERIVGALGIAMASGAREWTTDEISLAETVAAQLRSTIEAARLRQRERTIARQLQIAILPEVPEAVPGMNLRGFYRAALEEAEVGGDFIDVAGIGPDTTYLCVADLSGKGLAAAQQVALVKNTMLYAVNTSPGLAEAATSVNRMLAGQGMLTGFATLFAGVYDARTRRLTYVNAGQEPGLLWRAATGVIEELGSTGHVMGGFESPFGYAEKIVPLEPGDVLALFTDGLTEVGPNRKELLDLDGVRDRFGACCRAMETGRTARAMADCLVARVDAFSRGGARDDIALLVGVVV